MEFAFNVTRLAIWARNCFEGLLDGMLYKVDMQDPHKTDYWTCQKNVRQPSKFLVHEKFSRHSTAHTRKWMTNCQNRQNSLSNFLLHGRVCHIVWVCKVQMDIPMVQKNFVWLSRQQDVSVNLEVAHNALPVYLGNIVSFWGLRWNWRHPVIVTVFLSYDKR